MALLFFLVVFALLAAIEAAPRISRWLHRLARSDGNLARAFQPDPGVARIASRALTVASTGVVYDLPVMGVLGR
ncbi:hypothetical protein AB0I37_30525 [Micromonospora purpureochromogenes]|uniref:hypothetical protein n=1 Tax=Micromonospora purpureochromogenes TaxID=47872 RepID=UPI003406CBD5